MKHYPNSVSKALALLMALVMTLSLAVTSAFAVSYQDMNPKDDALLGTKFPVDATITLVTDKNGKDVSLSIPVSGMTKDALAAAVSTGTVSLSLERDDSRPYVNEELFPYAYAGGSLNDWLTEGDEHQFTDIKLSASEKNGKTVLDVSFHVNNYFYSTNRRTGVTSVDYSVPHVNGGYYIDLCGYFDLVAKNSGKDLGSVSVKVAPYENFNTMWEIYKELDTIVANGTKNGLYVEEFSMGQSTAGRDMPYLIVADSKASVSKWLALTEQAETDPDAVLAQIKSGALDEIRVPVMYSNIHSNEVAATDGVLDFAKMITSEKTIDYKTLTGFTAAGEKELKAEMGPVGAEGSVAIPDLVKDKASYLGYLTVDNNGKSGKVDLEEYYTVENKSVNVKDELLSDVFFILVPEENVDGRTYLTRHSTNGYDLNRDNSFQTTSETANMQQLIGTFNPMSLAEFHGRVQAFQCEPCDPPHEPNFEYDLLAEHLITGGEALGIAAVANNDGYNSYVIPQRDYLSYTGNGTETYWEDPWDDMSTSYTPQFAMLQGTVAYTVELPAYNDDTAQAAQYGTELDRTVIDEIGDPLMHLLRNSADHGLESNEERVRLGKPEVGSIFLDAYQDGNNVVIEVRDDGAGINIDRVRQKAIEKGSITEKQAETMTDKDFIDLLFQPSFSTAEKITDVSGRGVGLDVVKTKIEALGGNITAKTVAGEGSTFTISLPLTLAIIQALMVKVGEEKYAIPLGSINGIEDIAKEDISFVQSKEVINLRGRVIPILRLHDILDMEPVENDPESLIVVIMQKAEQQVGLVIDELIGQQETVIKSLGHHITCDKLFSGATILGDGEVALILDTNTLM